MSFPNTTQHLQTFSCSYDMLTVTCLPSTLSAFCSRPVRLVCISGSIVVEFEITLPYSGPVWSCESLAPGLCPYPSLFAMSDFTQERVLASAKALVPPGYRPAGSDDWGEPLLSGPQFLQLSSGFILLIYLSILFHYSVSVLPWSNIFFDIRFIVSGCSKARQRRTSLRPDHSGGG